MLGKRETDPSDVDHNLVSKRPKTSNEDGPNDAKSIASLLDFSSVHTTPEFHARFEQLARALLHQHTLVLTAKGKSTEYRILELEFYLRTSEHEDPYTHGSEEQKISGQWYFHRAPRRSNDSTKSLTSTSGYRGGTRKGLDITIGGPVKSPYFQNVEDESSEAYSPRGGILLRTLQRSDDKVVSGPSLLVDEILQRSGASSIKELVDTMWRGDISVCPPSCSSDEVREESTERHVFLRLQPSVVVKTDDLPHIYTSPRIGLDLSHPGTLASPNHPRVVFISKPYRHFIYPHLLKSNGRAQTFLGVNRHSLKDHPRDPFLDTIVRLTGMSANSAAKYLADYESGKASGVIQGFVGLPGKGVCSSASRYLKLIGALETFLAPNEHA
ncbi:hypothetical protein HGRIS_010360 [Hohenbuehelia grisea]|uniref:Uncharacterized protein n=1 Tax=Hohenbuehelia grisea TaxID=104357 RepID=A0ABR3J4G9_9AGAR